MADEIMDHVDGALNEIFFQFLCACLGFDPATDEASSAIARAYDSTETNVQANPQRDIAYYYWECFDIETEQWVGVEYSSGNSGLTANVYSRLPIRLNVICYGPNANSWALSIRRFSILDGYGYPRQLLRSNGFRIMDSPKIPTTGFEEDGKIWRKRADVSIPMISSDEEIYNGTSAYINKAAGVIMHRNGG